MIQRIMIMMVRARGRAVIESLGCGWGEAVGLDREVLLSQER